MEETWAERLEIACQIGESEGDWEVVGALGSGAATEIGGAAEVAEGTGALWGN